jgi:diguanylate cyclase (GGDEF)-like protein/PAS domain S-box-containing protein
MWGDLQQKFSIRETASGRRHYLLALLLVLLPLVMLALAPEVLRESPLLIVLFPVIFSAYAGGLGPGLFATLASALLAWGILVPADALPLSPGKLALFVLAGTCISVLSERSLAILRYRATMHRQLLALARLVDSTDDSVVSIDSKGVISHWNRGAEALFGYKAHEAVGLKLDALIPPWLHEAEQAVFERIQAGERIAPYETQRLRKDGTLIDIGTTVSPILDVAGRVVGISRISCDISAKKQAEQDKAEAEARFQALVEHAIAGVYIVQDGLIVYANQALADIFGAADSETLLGRRLMDWVEAADRARVAEKMTAQLQNNSEAMRYRFTTCRADGSRMAVEVHGKQIGYNHRPAIIGTLLDASEAERREAELAHAVREKTRLLAANERSLRTILDNMPALISYYDTRLRHLFGNQAYCDWYRVPLDRLAGLPVEDVIPPGRYEVAIEHIGRALAGQAQIFEHEMRRDGDPRPWQAQVHLIPDLHDGEVGGLFALALDITPRKQAEMALRESEARFRQLFESAPVGISVYSSDGRCIMVNQAQAELAGATREQLLAQNFRALDNWRQSGLLSIALKALDSGRPQHYELHMMSSFGRYMELDCEFTLPIVDGIRYLMLLAKDITPYRQAARLMKQAMDAELDKARLDHQYRLVVENMIDGFFAFDQQGRMHEVNAAFTRMSGFERGELLGGQVSAIEADGSGHEFMARLRRITQHGSDRFECRLRRKDGQSWPAEISASYARTEGGKIFAFVRDISERKQSEDEIRRLAFYDSLTALPNRQLLLDRLQQVLVSCRRNHRHGALLFIDLDNFKLLNDTFGHDMGDRLLVQVANRLRNCVRARDTVARLGGDEFIILLDDLDRNRERAAGQARTVAASAMDALNHPYLLGAHEYHNTPSIGVAMFNDRDRTSVEEQLKHADLAMYQAKAAGRNTMCFFDPVTQAEVETRSSLENELRQALRDDQLILHYQPQVDRDGRRVGAEGLVRWQHPQRGLIAPAQFIGLAEESGLVHGLGLRVLEIACAQLAAWRDAPATQSLTLAANVSARQFRHRDFVAQIRALIERSGIDPSRLKLELTESLLVDNIEESTAKMLSLRSLGVRFSLDDFGTGYSSLAYLKSLPLEQVKIDRSFVRDILTDPNDAAIVRAIISMGHSLGLTVVAEGVETAEQWHYLLGEECDIGQGYYFSPPVAIEHFERDPADAAPVAREINPARG